MKKTILSVMAIALVSATAFLTSCKSEDKDNPPLIKSVKVEGEGPYTVKAEIVDDNGALKSVDLFYKKSTESEFVTVKMENTTGAIYSGEIPAQTEDCVILYYVKAVNSVNLTTYHPADAPTTTHKFDAEGETVPSYYDLKINEIWAAAETDKEKFIELYNTSNGDIDISGVYFKRNNEDVGEIPENTILAAGKYYILGTKGNIENPNNPDEPYDHFITSGFSGKKSVLFVMFSPQGEELDRFLRGSEDNLDDNMSPVSGSFCRIPNGTGDWKLVDNPTLRAENDPTGATDIDGGSSHGVVLNEIWAGAPSDNEKFIELYNASNKDIDISNVYFERNEDGNVVGTIPENTVLAAGQYYILGTKNNTTNPNDPNAPYDHSISSGFSAKKSVRLKMFSPKGDLMDMFLRGSEDNLDVNISDLAPGSFCRIPNGTGEWKLVDNPTLRAENDPTGARDIPND